MLRRFLCALHKAEHTAQTVRLVSNEAQLLEKESEELLKAGYTQRQDEKLTGALWFLGSRA